MKLDKDFICWCAGLFDGEGSVSIPHIKVSGQYYLAVRIAQNIEPVLRDIAARFNFTSVVYCDKEYTAYRAKRPMWRLILGNKKAEIFLRTIYPHLKIKRKQAELGLQFQEMLHGSLPKAEKDQKKVLFKQKIEQINSSGVWVP